MRFLVRFSFPTDVGNQRMKDPEFGVKFQKLFTDIKAEAVYFTTICGERGGYAAVSIDDASKLASIAERFFFWLNADVEFMPVMVPDDLKKAMPEIQAISAKY